MGSAFNPFDLFVLVVLVLATFWGGVRGIVSQLSSLLSWLVSAYIATHHYQIVAKFMSSSFSFRIPMAMIITFIVSVLLIRILTSVVKNFVSMAGLGEFDRQMGAFLGLIKGLLLCLLMTFLMIITTEKTRELIEESNTGPYFASFISMIQSNLPDSEITQKFGYYVEQYQRKESEAGTSTKTISREIDDLKSLLISTVFSKQATDIVAEAEEINEPTSYLVSSASEKIMEPLFKTIKGKTDNNSDENKGNSSEERMTPTKSSIYSRKRLFNNEAKGSNNNNDLSINDQLLSISPSLNRYDVSEAIRAGKRELIATTQNPMDEKNDRIVTYPDNLSKNELRSYGGNDRHNKSELLSSDNGSSDGLGDLAVFLASIGGGYGGYEDRNHILSESEINTSSDLVFDEHGPDYEENGFSTNYSMRSGYDSLGVENVPFNSNRIGSREYYWRENEQMTDSHSRLNLRTYTNYSGTLF